MLCLGDYKLIYYHKAEVLLLFNLKEDPHEMNNLAENPEYAELLRKCWAILKQRQVELGDPLELKELL